MLLTLCYLSLTIIIALYEIFRKRHRHLLDTISVFNAMTIFYYIFPAVMITNKDILGYSSNPQYGALNISAGVFVCILINYCIFIFVRMSLNKYVLTGSKRKLYFLPSEEQITYKLGIVVLMFATACFIPYASLLGGVTNLLLHTSEIRGGVIESPNASIMFLSKLFTCAYLAPVFMCGCCVGKHRWVKTLSFITAFAIMFSYGGRSYVLMFLLIFVLGSTSRDYLHIGKVRYENILIAVLLVIFCIVILRPFFDVLRYLRSDGLLAMSQIYLSSISSTDAKYSIGGGVWGTLKNLCKSFEHRPYSLDIALSQILNGDHCCGWGKEIVVALISLLPSLLLGINRPLSITQYNSAYIAGGFGILQIPSGCIAAGIYEFHLLGLFIYPIVLAIASFMIDRFYYRTEHTKIAPYLNMVLLFLFNDIGTGGDITSSIPRNLTVLIFLFVLRLHMYSKGRFVRT